MNVRLDRPPAISSIEQSSHDVVAELVGEVGADGVVRRCLLGEAVTSSVGVLTPHPRASSGGAPSAAVVRRLS